MLVTDSVGPAALADPGTTRYHGLDLLRGSMMLLGVVLHVALCFQPEPGSWLYQDPRGTPLAGFLVIAIHAFRMPVFFAMAGFFGALVVQRKGWMAFTAGRINRIAIPLALGWFLLAPLMSWSLVFAWTLIGLDAGGDADGPLVLEALRTMTFAVDFGVAGPMHLWFLAYLILFCPLGLALSGVRRLIPARARKAFGVGALVLCVLASTAGMLLMNDPGIDTPEGWAIEPPILLTYAAFFLGGWAFRELGGAVPFASRFSLAVLGMGLGLLCGATFGAAAEYYARATVEGHEPGVRFLACQLSHAATGWVMLAGLAGAAEWLVRRPRAIIRYLVDASYWVYLIHMPLTFFVPAALRGWDTSPYIKMPVSILIVTAICLITYELFVRRTVLRFAVGSTRTARTPVPPT